MLKICEHSGLISAHNLGGLYDHIMSSRVFTLIMNYVMEVMRKMVMDVIWNWQSSHTNFVLRILQEVDLNRHF